LRNSPRYVAPTPRVWLPLNMYTPVYNARMIRWIIIKIDHDVAHTHTHAHTNYTRRREIFQVPGHGRKREMTRTQRDSVGVGVKVRE
jgi:hypothetical protein